MSAKSSESGAQAKPRLLDLVHEAIRRRYFSRRTEEAYVHWIKRFIYFSGKRHPRDLGEPEVTAFLNHLAAERHVAPATQNQALSALLFLYKEVLGRELAWLDGLKRPTRPPRLPVVLTRAEVQRLLAQITGTRWLIASLLYGSGLRVIECLRLRSRRLLQRAAQLLRWHAHADAGTLFLERHCGAAVAAAPSASHRLFQFRKRRFAHLHRHAVLAREFHGERHVLVR